MKNKLPWRHICRRCLTTLTAAVLLGLTGACSDANEPEVKDVQVNGFKEQDPAGYAAYTARLRQWKATEHAIVYACLDNAPEVSVSERDFLRSLPDSIDIVAMRNADRLSQFDREDMTLVRNDYGTRVVYYLDCATATAEKWQEATNTMSSGQFDGVTIASTTAPESTQLQALAEAATGKTMIFEGSPSVLSADQIALFDYFIVDVSAAADSYDVELQVRLALLSVPATKLLLGTKPGGVLTDASGVSRNSIAGVANAVIGFSPQLGGIAINGISADYYDPDIIYKRTRGAIHMLNPANK